MTSMVAGDELRRVLRRLPTGVTVITADTPAGPVGLAANSVTSVSLDPPLILVCPAKNSTTWPSIRAARCFCVNVMARHHEHLTRAFSMKGVDRFAGVRHRRLRCGPGLDDALAWIECTIREEHEAGDHTIVVADVGAIHASDDDQDPLVFFGGRYGTFHTGAG